MSPSPPVPAGADIVEVCAALGETTRWQILEHLGGHARSASELAEELPISRQAIARHLAVLAEVGLVDSHRAGKQIRYTAVGAGLSRLATRLEVAAAQWDQRLDRLTTLAEAAANEAGARGPQRAGKVNQ